MIKKLAYLEIVVIDFERAVEWYTKILGLELDGEIAKEQSGLWCQLKTQTGDKRLALWQPVWIPSQEKNLDSLIPICEVAELDEIVADLKPNGVKFLEEIRQMVNYRITTIADLEGNRLQLFEPNS